eukprot:XP_027299920.1 uncharacterized protein LOC106017755 isoform X5 [Anas platyrhynchos]
MQRSRSMPCHPHLVLMAWRVQSRFWVLASSMGQAQGTATRCRRLLFLLFVLLLLVAPCPGETLNIPRLGLHPGSPLKTGSEPWGNPRALPTGHPSRRYSFLKHPGFSRDLSSNVGSASSLQDRGMEEGRNCMENHCWVNLTFLCGVKIQTMWKKKEKWRKLLKRSKVCLRDHAHY